MPPGSSATSGATVTKLEPPEGDALRRQGHVPPGGDASSLFAYTSSGKRSVTIDDASAEGRDRLLRLIADSDILVDAHRASHWRGLDIDFEALPGSGRCRLGGLDHALRALRRARGVDGDAPDGAPRRR